MNRMVPIFCGLALALLSFPAGVGWADCDEKSKDGQKIETECAAKSDGGAGHRHGSWWGSDGGHGRPWKKCPLWKCLWIYLAVLHLLLTIIVFKDIRRAAPYMNSLWVVAVLMGGLPATVAYAVFRLALSKTEPR